MEVQQKSSVTQICGSKVNACQKVEGHLKNYRCVAHRYNQVFLLIPEKIKLDLG